MLRLYIGYSRNTSSRILFAITPQPCADDARMPLVVFRLYRHKINEVHQYGLNVYPLAIHLLAS